jgi:hypothetical protein
MNKSLITEISRIHEIMGIKHTGHKLLLEGGVIFGVAAREYAEEGSQAVLRQEFKDMIEDLSPYYGKKSNGLNMVFDDFVDLGKRYAKDAGETTIDEATALSYFFKKFGSEAVTDYQKVLTKLRLQRMKAVAQQLEQTAAENAKKSLQTFRDKVTEARRQLDAGEIDLPAYKSSLDSLVAFFKGTKTTETNKLIKDTLLPEMEKTAKELEDFDFVKNEAGVGVRSSAAEDLEKRLQDELQSAFEQQQKNSKLNPMVKEPTVPTLAGKETSEQTLETLPKKTEPIGFGNESTITESLSRNSNYQTKLRRIYDKMFSFLKDSQKRYLDIIDETERANMENFKRSLIERFQKDGITEITVTAKDWMNKVKSGNATAGRSTKMTIEEFEKEIENYFLFTTKDNKWSPLNKIDTNYNSNSKEFWTLIKTLYPEDAERMLKEGLTDSDFDKIIKDLETKMLNNDLTLKKYLNNWLVDDPMDTNGFLSDVLINSKTGKEIETIANTFADKFSKNVADVSEGSPYDILLNLDGIRRLSQDTPFGKQGELKTIQTKKVAGIKDLGNGRYWVTTRGKLEIPKQDQVDILFLSTTDGKTLAIGKQTPYLNPLGKKSFPSALRTQKGRYGFYVDTDTPKMSSL